MKRYIKLVKRLTRPKRKKVAGCREGGVMESFVICSLYVKWRRMWGMRDMISMYEMLVGKLQQKSLCGRQRLSWEDIKINSRRNCMRGCWLVSYGPVAVDMVISVLIHDVQIDNFECIVTYVFRMHKLKYIQS
jgi:hypothetical protein